MNKGVALKKKGDRVYNGAYGNGTVLSVDNRRGRQRTVFIDGKSLSIDDPVLVINFDNWNYPIDQFDSDVGFLNEE